VRLAASVIVIGLAAGCLAERLIYIPTAHKIPFGSVRYELRAEPRVSGVSENYIGIGATTSWELEYRRQDLDSDRQIDAFDLTYNFISPITDFTPGFALGIQDVFDRTADGRRPFFVVTFREGFSTIGGESPADITLGFSSSHRQVYPLVGASIPFSKQVRFMAEHDGLRISIGMEARPVRNLSLRWTLREGTSLLGFEFQGKF